MKKLLLWGCGSIGALLMACVPFGVLAQDDVAVPTPVSAQENVSVQLPVTISVFVREDCAHCAAEKVFLTQLMAQRGGDIRVMYHDLDAPGERARFGAVAQKFGLSQGTPITLVGTTIFSGFDTAQTTGVFMERLVDAAQESTTFDAIVNGTAPAVTIASSLEGASVCADDPTIGCDTDGLSIRLPLIGTQVNLATLSLPVVSMLLGFVDGFNPCALWVLIVFLTLLLQTGSRRRMWQYAGLFILAEAVMYWLILMVWFSAWDFIGLSRIVTPLVGLLALGSGVYFLHKFLTWKPICTVTSLTQQKTLTDKITALVQQPLTWVTALGVVMLAFSVNVFEFACSIGIPQAYTKILELNDLSFLATQGQMALYIIMYMVDDVIVFALALYGANHLSNTMKYSRWTTLIGAVLMLVLGALMLFAPEKLVF